MESWEAVIQEDVVFKDNERESMFGFEGTQVII